MDTLAAFRSRSEAMKFFRILTKERIASATVSTPSRLNLGCGLSVVFPGYLKERAKKIISDEKFVSFVGFFAR